MPRADFYATTALGLSLAVAPLSLTAQSPESDPAAIAMFVPLFQTCVMELTIEHCQPYRDIVTECTEAFEQDVCEALFDAPDLVFGDSVQFEQAQLFLSQTMDALVAMDFNGEEVELGQGVEGLPDVTVEERDAERGEVEEATPATETEPGTMEDRSQVEVPSDGEVGPLIEEALEEQPSETDQALSVPEADAGVEGADDQVQHGTAVEVEAEAEAGSELDTEVDVDPPVVAVAEAETVELDGAVIEPELLNDIEVDLTDAETRAEVAEEPGDTEEPRSSTADEESAETLVPDAGETGSEEQPARLSADAEEPASEAPELVLEATPEQEFVAPVEEQRELDVEQRDALDLLMEDPEIAAAIAVLSSMTEINTEVTGELPGTSDVVPLAALQSEQLEDRDSEHASRVEVEEVTENRITAAEVRTSSDDFASGFALDFDAAQAHGNDRSDLERAGLVALGAMVVGMIVERNRVVARSDERVVVLRDDGEYAVWRDDDIILLQEGAERMIERYSDGSTLTRWDRTDGSQIFSVRDATGRLLWRELVLSDGTSIELVNDTRLIEPIDVSTLPPSVWRELRITERTDPELALALLREAEADARAVDRAFTLRQVREFREVRELVPILSPQPITFETNRANVRPGEARKLAQLGRLMERLIADNPREVFLIEGHTDATGPAAYNLALSDRRAESVALALTEFFAIPPENLIIQGFGERHLRVPTVLSEERNRRVAVRRITPLLWP